MSQSAVINKFIQLATIGLQSVNIDLKIAEEEGCAIVRNYIVDFNSTNEIQIFEVNNLELPFATIPQDGVASAATLICSEIASGIIARVIEDAD